MHKIAHPFIAAVALTALAPSIALACASCGCTLSSDWSAQGLSGGDSGWSADLRYDLLDQNRLRSGTHRVSASEGAAMTTPDGDPLEVERNTTNHYLTLAVDHSTSANWGVRVALPWIVRSHSTLGEGSDGSSPADGAYTSRTASLGDVQVVGRYMGLLPSHELTVQFGAKLPTGSTNRSGTSTDPATPGDVANIDPGLQPGTGSTDLILGLGWAGELDDGWAGMAQAQWQRPILKREGYTPGVAVQLNLGLRYQGWTTVQPQVQLNLRRVQRDAGELADTVSTGGTLAYLSPGLNVPVARGTIVYGHVQLPVYRKVNGLQLVQQRTLSVGVQHSF